MEARAVGRGPSPWQAAAINYDSEFDYYRSALLALVRVRPGRLWLVRFMCDDTLKVAALAQLEAAFKLWPRVSESWSWTLAE